MYKTITEGKAIISVPDLAKISKEMPVFYNPTMKFNRDISVILLNCLGKKDIKIGLPLAGTGVRGIRFIKELKMGIIKKVIMNDYDEEAIKIMKKNLKANNIPIEKYQVTKIEIDSLTDTSIEIHNTEANMFLLSSHGFEYIDIDPFGSPNPFLDASIKRTSRDGILAITATDTAPLCGTYIKTCLRKYWASPIHTYEMHEVGIRILIRKIQLIGAQYEKALIPIFSYSKDHYFRIFFRSDKGKKKVDEMLKKHQMYKEAGPLWTGNLWDKKLVKSMIKEQHLIFSDKKIDKFLSIINDEIDVVGLTNVNLFSKKFKIKQTPKKELILSELKKRGHKASNTHISNESIKTDASEKILYNVFNDLL